MSNTSWDIASVTERDEVMEVLKKLPNIRRSIKAKQASLPFDAENVALAYGLPILKRKMPKGIGAFLNPAASDSGWEIVVNSELSEWFQFWAIIHELSHYIGDKKCERPDFLIEEPIPFMLAGLSHNNDYLHKVVCLDSLHNRTDGQEAEISYYLDDLMLPHEMEARASSERKARYISGYIAIPSWLFEARMSFSKIAESCMVSEQVVRKQFTIYSEDKDRLFRS